MNVPAEGATTELWRILLSGDVQGSGIRPRLAQVAEHFQVSGTARNSRAGVELEIIADPAVLQQFMEHLDSAEPQAQVAYLNRSRAECDSVSRRFTIESSDLTGENQCHLPLDRVICTACLAEIFQANHRRYGYPFNSCTRCGPRYSLLRAMPYDRERTSMADFAMCAACNHEYQDIRDSRYYSQLNACPECGPRLWLDLKNLAGPQENYAAIAAAAAQIRSGAILALKGIGGYQLICDATSYSSVATLRARKGRPSKPLAVMIASLTAAHRLAYLDPTEQQALSSSAGPIVLARARGEHGLAENIHPGLSDIGLMLPTSALHALLLAAVERPLVVTSGNIEGEPIETDPLQASERLGSIADCFLHHNRTIEQPVDDSVVRCMAGRTVTIRAARGLAPMPLNCVSKQAVLAVGGEQKVAIGVADQRLAYLGPHLGDMNSLGNQARFRDQQRRFTQLLACSPQALLADQHPDYFTARWTSQSATQPVQFIQHHHGHILAGMLEHGWLDQQVLGFAFDGTGLGPDGSIWGGEVLIASRQHYQRVASLRPFALAGGEAAVRQPWRIAISLMTSALNLDAASIADILGLHEAQVQSIVSILRVPNLSPVTTSMGRLFDGIAAIALSVHENRFEGDAASQLEACCDQAVTGAYALPLTSSTPAQWDWHPLIRDLVAQRVAGQPAGELSMRFHRGLAHGMAKIAEAYPHYRIVCMGGVFQNRLLCEMLNEIWRERALPAGLPGRIPPGDGGLAAGQLAALSTSPNF